MLPVLGSLLLAALVPGVATGAPGGAEYVALGDSGAATTGIQNFDVDAPLLCAQSTTNTPKLVARELGLQLDDRTCSSARIPHLTTSQSPGVAPQFDGLGPNTKVVTLHIGANDAQFTRNILACHVGSLAGRACSDSQDPLWGNDIAAVGRAYATALRRIHQLAPNATVFVDGWPLYVRDTSCADLIGLTPRDAAYIQSKFDALNDVVSREAVAHDAVYIDTRARSTGHDMCAAPGIRWFEPLVAGQTLVPYHPTLEGMQGVADVVVAAMRASGVS